MGTKPVNSDLLHALESYLGRRHGLGFKLIEAERITRRFLEWLWDQGNVRATFTAAEAIVWAQGAGSFKNSYKYQRFSAVRSFAHYCLALGLDVQVPSVSAVNPSKDRRVPHIYNQSEIDALITACKNVFIPVLVQETMATIIALLAVSGMRVGEDLRSRPQEIQCSDATMLIRANKHGPDRLIPLHPTTENALAKYESSPHRQAVGPQPDGPLFVSTRGTAYLRGTVEDHFQRIRAAAGFTWDGTTPCLHDLRHGFATWQMIRAYTTDDGDPAARLGLLATWLGHSDPAHTYWYVQAVPELLALAAARRNNIIAKGWFLMTYLAAALQWFFTDYVHTQRNLSANTIASYRDSWRLLLKFARAAKGTSADQLRLEDIDRDMVVRFLDHLINDKHNSAATRNAHLIAVRVLFAHYLPDHPEHAETIRRILTIPPAKTSKPRVCYLNEVETTTLLEAPATKTWTGRRDQMMFALVINTGLRISELTGLTIAHVHTGTSPYIECEGKGRKHRATTINAQTRDQMRDYLKERLTRTGVALFPGPHGDALSRDAIERRLAIHLQTAARTCPSIAAKHVTMHTLRHTTAMNLLHASVDITVIALWLGHEQTGSSTLSVVQDAQRGRSPAVYKSSRSR